MLQQPEIEDVPEFRKLVGDCKFVSLTAADCAADIEEDVAWLLDFRSSRDTRKPEEVRILDFGCGRGRLVGQLRRRGFRAFGIDIDSRFIESGRVLRQEREDEFPVLSLAGADSRAKFPEGYFDVIVSDQVLEHVSNLSEVAAEMARLLGPGGVLLLMFPAKYRPVECHYFLPFVHWLPKNGLRLLAIRLLVKAGLGVRFMRPISARLKAEAIYKFSVEQTFYRPRREIVREFAKVGIALDFASLPRAKFGRKLSRLGTAGKSLAIFVERLTPAVHWYTTFRACLPVGEKLAGKI